LLLRVHLHDAAYCCSGSTYMMQLIAAPAPPT
jgi:hypothetical protein